MTLSDNIMLLKDSLKTTLSRHPLLSQNATANALIKHLKLKNVQRIINGKPNTTVILTNDTVIRIPLDKLSETRCRINKLMLKKLSTTSISSFVPRFLEEGKFQNRRYYCETRLPGIAIDLPISNMDNLIEKAADFITKFHQDTSNDIIINESNYRRLFGREFQKLYKYLNDEYKTKLKMIEGGLKREMLGKQFKTVWFQGDYKIENILFDAKTWQINGIIDWDLSRQESLPLLDIFYLLAYKQTTLTKKSIVNIFLNKFHKANFTKSEQQIIDKYLGNIELNNEFIKPLLIMFWLNHVSQRFHSSLTDITPEKEKYLIENIYNVIDEEIARK